MRVLVVDDEEGVRTAVCRGLRADGFAVDTADNGEDALWMAMNNPYAAIVLDVLLPKLNGYVVCARLREAKNWTPVLMLTAKDGDYDQTDGLEAGADDYVIKPFSYMVLVARLRALIRRSEREPVLDVLESGTLRFDTRQRRCFAGTEEIKLSAKTAAMLEYFLRRQGEVVSKDEIVAGVWDQAFDGDLNIVEVYVARLRTALDAVGLRGRIETIRGIGYRFHADRDTDTP